MRYVTLPSLLALALSVTGAARAGDIYCNNQGHDCSDRPTPGATFVGSTISQVRPSSEPAAAPATSSAAAAADAAANARLSQDASRAAVQKDVATNHAEQCKAAKDKYQQSIDSRRIYRMNKAGEREYLSDAELDQARLNARLEMERSCGSPSG